jgi:hypothetical protein
MRVNDQWRASVPLTAATVRPRESLFTSLLWGSWDQRRECGTIVAVETKPMKSRASPPRVGGRWRPFKSYEKCAYMIDRSGSESSLTVLSRLSGRALRRSSGCCSAKGRRPDRPRTRRRRRVKCDARERCKGLRTREAMRYCGFEDGYSQRPLRRDSR